MNTLDTTSVIAALLDDLRQCKTEGESVAVGVQILTSIIEMVATEETGDWHGAPPFFTVEDDLSRARLHRTVAELCGTW